MSASLHAGPRPVSAARTRIEGAGVLVVAVGAGGGAELVPLALEQAATARTKTAAGSAHNRLVTTPGLTSPATQRFPARQPYDSARASAKPS